jgi:hypothetical protein
MSPKQREGKEKDRKFRTLGRREESELRERREESEQGAEKDMNIGN